MGMARGSSGRVVVEIDPQLKRRLYAALAAESLTLKDWFTQRAEEQVADREQPSLFAGGTRATARDETA